PFTFSARSALPGELSVSPTGALRALNVNGILIVVIRRGGTCRQLGFVLLGLANSTDKIDQQQILLLVPLRLPGDELLLLLQQPLAIFTGLIEHQPFRDPHECRRKILFAVAALRLAIISGRETLPAIRRVRVATGI